MSRFRVVLIFLCLLLPALSSAHILLIDKKIAVLLHVDPEDDPKVGEEAHFFLEFTDKDDLLRIERCQCRFIIASEGTDLFEISATSSKTTLKGNALSFPFTFPVKGIYTFTVIGGPLQDEEFKAFKMVYEIEITRGARADKTQANTKKTGHTLHSAAALVAALFVVGSLVYEHWKKRGPATGNEM